MIGFTILNRSKPRTLLLMHGLFTSSGYCLSYLQSLRQPTCNQRPKRVGNHGADLHAHFRFDNASDFANILTKITHDTIINIQYD